MKKFFYIIVLLTACTTANKQDFSATDSINGMSEAEFKAHFVDSIMKAAQKEASNLYEDTIGLWKAPVKVTSARLITKEYSNYRDLQLTYKNETEKRIDAIKFQWYGENAFKEPADMGNSFAAGFGGGFSDRSLGPKGSQTSTFGIMSRDGKKVVLAWPTEVAFSDGSIWKLK